MGITNELPDQLSRMQGPSPGQLPPILRAVPECKPPSRVQGFWHTVTQPIKPQFLHCAHGTHVCVSISHYHGWGVLCQAAGVERSMSPKRVLGIGGVPRRA
eukprot:118406-Amphidinium_carterae.1